MATPFAIGAARGQECAGDCEGSDTVAINELIGCVGIALGSETLGTCDACDVDGNTVVSIGEIITAVNAALDGCPVRPAPSAVAHFAPATNAMDWGDVPFPSDLYRDATGAIRFDVADGRTDTRPARCATRWQRDGFCATCNVYFPVEGEIDLATLPANDTPALGDAVLLADVDPQSPERGRLFPLRLEWNPARHLLALRPVAGIALHRSRLYAAVLTTALQPARPAVAPGGTFRQARRRSSSADAEIERARTVLAPALDELERLGIGRNRIVALASFTTEDVTADVLSARAAVQGGPPFEVVIERWRRGEEIDELLGIPGEDRPGIDVPPAAGVAGTRSIVHGAIGDIISGYFVAPRIVSGTGTDIGTALRDERGAIVAGPREHVPFLLTLPAVRTGAPVPIVVAHHGFTASRTTCFASSNTAARAGVAVLAIDAFQHGDRAATTHDDVNAIRGVPGPDGFAETDNLDVLAHVFGLVGAAPGLELFPGYPVGAFLQFGADVASAVRVAREGSLAQALRDGGMPDFAGFDPQRIGFIGNSLGAVVGASVLTAEPDVRAGVQNVPPGSIAETLAQSPAFRPLVDSLFLPAWGRRHVRRGQPPSPFRAGHRPLAGCSSRSTRWPSPHTSS